MENDQPPPSKILDTAELAALVPTNIGISKGEFLTYLQPMGGMAFLEKLLPTMLNSADGELPPQFRLVLDGLHGAEPCWFAMGVGGHEGWRIEVKGDGSKLPPELFGGAFVEMLEQLTSQARSGGDDPATQMAAMLKGFLGADPDDDDGPIDDDIGAALNCTCDPSLPPNVDDPWAPGDTFTCQKCGRHAVILAGATSEG